MSNNYSAPTAELVQTGETTGGSLDDALEGNYSIELADILSEAWQKTKGAKRYILGAGVLMYLITFVLVFVVTFIALMVAGGDPDSASPAAIIIPTVVQIGSMALMLPFTAGIFVICLKQVQGHQPEFSDLFSCFNKTGTLLITMLLMYIMIFIGYLLFILPGIYLSFAYMMAIPLIVDRDMGPWEALETSRKALTKHWFGFFLFFIVLSIIVVLAMLPIMIPLIWIVPMAALSMVILYRDVFGIASY